MRSPLSVVVERGGIAEAVHVAHAVAVRDGDVVDYAGDPDRTVWMRSVAKPIQALPLALEDPDLPEAELAIACASHDATDEQVAAVRALLARSGSTEDELECGPERGRKLDHSCSGKHAGMLLRSKRHGWPLPGYRLPDHPTQREAARLVADAAGTTDVAEGTDGCGVVTFALPLRAVAAAFARLARRELAGSERVISAMLARPDLVGGPTAPDTVFMWASPGAFAKRGAEGLLCAGLPDGIGVAVKVEDGAMRAAGPALARFVGILGLVEAPLLNSRGERVGRIAAGAGRNRVPVFPNRV